MHRYDQTCCLWIGSILKLFSELVVQSLDVARLHLFHSLHLFLVDFLHCFVFLIHLFTFINDLLGDRLVDSEFSICFPLSFRTLGHQHLPPPNVIHSLILMRKQVSFDKWTISHVDATPSGLEWSFPAQISYCHLRAFIASTVLLGYNIPCDAIPYNLVRLRPI